MPMLGINNIYMKGINACCLCNAPNAELKVPVYKATIKHGCFVIVGCYVCETCLNNLEKETNKKE